MSDWPYDSHYDQFDPYPTDATRSLPKPNIGSVYPPNAIEGEWARHEPLITPKQLRERDLWGIPLISNMRDPSGKRQEMTNDNLKDYIEGAIVEAETDTGIDIMPTVHREKQAYDRQDYESFGYFRTRHRPVSQLEKLSLTPSSERDIFVVPLNWVATSYLYRGQINIIPITPAAAASGYVLPPGAGPAGAFLSIFARHSWIPEYWQIEYRSGFDNGRLPRIVNELIAAYAAKRVLSLLSSTYARSSGHSLGIDGMSQSISTPGPALFDNRLAVIEEKRRNLVKKIKTMYGLKLFSGAV